VTVRIALAALALAACGKDVDIGGTQDASAPTFDASFSSAVCDPCASDGDCAPGVSCTRVTEPDQGFCLRRCESATCDADDACTSTTNVTGDALRACVPRTGECTPAAPPPPSADGAPLEQCGEIVGPTISASCHSCSEGSSGCQKNGCYGGWWCNTDTRRCEKPPSCK
jgi:hypothetical protein